MSRDELIALASSCESATGPSRELDLRIEAAINPEYDGLEEGLARFLVRYGGHPAFTASIDAAMKLVPEGLMWALTNCDAGELHPDFSKASAIIGNPDDPSKPSVAATPALALVAASLRAKAGDT